MDTLLFQDTETFSPIPIKNGLYAYSEEVEVMLYAYAFNEEPVSVVDLTAGEAIPNRVLDALGEESVLSVFHNAPFDVTVMREALGIHYDLTRVHCTMVQAYAHALPGGLATLSETLGVPSDMEKDKRGKQLIQLFCKPRPKNMKLRRATRETHPTEWQQFIDYAGNDIEAMRHSFKKMPMWNYRRRPTNDYLAQGCERTLWELDREINNRGFTVDTVLAEKAIEEIKIKQKQLAKSTQKATHGDVDRATQRDKMLAHILEYYGVDLPDMKKSTLERRIQDPNLPIEVKELLGLRLEASTSSTSKYKKLLECVSFDGKLRGTLQFDGASRTRRWAGRLFQPQNLPRPSHKQEVIDESIELIKMGALGIVEDDVMGLTSSCIRGCIVASEGKKLYVSDLSNIEGRFAAWVAEEDWKVKAFAEIDRGIGTDMYKQSYGRAFDVDPESVQDNERQIGKVMELMLQYGGGVGAFLTGAMTYRIDLDELAEVAGPTIPKLIFDEAYGFYEWTLRQKRSTFGLSADAFIVCDALKRMWREAHPAISSYWKELEDTCKKAIERRDGTVYQCRKVKIKCRGAWLRIILPSGHSLCYPSPEVRDGQITYMGVCPYSRKWRRLKTYGGKLLENICQSGSRDVMAYNMPLVECEGYEILLTVHDELITEAPDRPMYGHEPLSDLLAQNPIWAPDLPLAAGGFEAYRYRKD